MASYPKTYWQLRTILRGMLHAARCLGFLFLMAAIARSQSVSERNGRIFFTDQNGVRKAITDGSLDSQPYLSFDKQKVVFVRQTPGQTIETGLSEVNKTELWIASVDGGKQSRRVLTGGELHRGAEREYSGCWI
jgi:hypothetical protein